MGGGQVRMIFFINLTEGSPCTWHLYSRICIFYLFIGLTSTKMHTLQEFFLNFFYVFVPCAYSAISFNNCLHANIVVYDVRVLCFEIISLFCIRNILLFIMNISAGPIGGRRSEMRVQFFNIFFFSLLNAQLRFFFFLYINHCLPLYRIM